jgi:HPt (histidine-containing phosphotransfer) domain-containing protein/anti-anti-sigma regulatory factor
VSEILDDFIFDSREQLQNAGAQLLALEKDPHSLANINALMGILHTIKGNSGFVNLRHLYELLHSAESLLQTVRETPDHYLPPKVVESLFQVLDTVEAIMGRLENGEDDEVEWMGSLVETISEVSRALDSGELCDRKPEPDIAPESVAVGSQASPQPKVLAHPIRPASGDEVRTPSPRKGRKAKKAAEPSLATSDGPAVPSFALKDGVPYIALTDGLLDTEGEGLWTEAEGLRGDGSKGLILDLRGLDAISTGELGMLRKFHDAWGDGLAIILNQGERPDLYRVFDVLGLSGRYKFYPEEGAAEATLRKGA